MVTKNTTTKKDTTTNPQAPKEETGGQLLARIQDRLTTLETQASERFGELVERGRNLEGYRKLAGLAEHSRAAQVLQDVETKIKENDLLARANKLSTQIEQRIGGQVERVFRAVGLVTQTDLKAVDRRLRNLSRRLNTLDKKAA